MSDLKHQTIEELQKRKGDTRAYIVNLECKLNAEKQRLEWIEKYLQEKRQQEADEVKKELLLLLIAQQKLGLETLATKGSNLDFREFAVWQISQALRAAFEAGKESLKC